VILNTGEDMQCDEDIVLEKKRKEDRLREIEEFR